MFRSGHVFFVSSFTCFFHLRQPFEEMLDYSPLTLLHLAELRDIQMYHLLPPRNSAEISFFLPLFVELALALAKETMSLLAFLFYFFFLLLHALGTSTGNIRSTSMGSWTIFEKP